MRGSESKDSWYFDRVARKCDTTKNCWRIKLKMLGSKNITSLIFWYFLLFFDILIIHSVFILTVSYSVWNLELTFHCTWWQIIIIISITSHRCANTLLHHLWFSLYVGFVCEFSFPSCKLNANPSFDDFFCHTFAWNSITTRFTTFVFSSFFRLKSSITFII